MQVSCLAPARAKMSDADKSLLLTILLDLYVVGGTPSEPRSPMTPTGEKSERAQRVQNI